MTKRLITWVDMHGRYRVTSPAYNDPTRPKGETELECLERVWLRLVNSGKYGITADSPHFFVEDADIRVRISECCGHHFRYPPMLGSDQDKEDVRTGQTHPDRIAKFAWTMGEDGLPIVNMPKARGVQMDHIRLVRNTELTAKDVTFIRAVEAGDTDAQATITTEKQTLRDIPQTFDLTTDNDTPAELKAKWPTELPARE
jgi:hypothetical protein